MIPEEKFSVILSAKNEEFVIQEIIESCCYYASVIIFIYRQVATLAKKIKKKMLFNYYFRPAKIVDTLTNLNSFSDLYRLGQFSKNYFSSLFDKWKGTQSEIFQK